jgi:hypothetical protein
MQAIAVVPSQALAVVVCSGWSVISPMCVRIEGDSQEDGAQAEVAVAMMQVRSHITFWRWTARNLTPSLRYARRWITATSWSSPWWSSY